MSTCSGWTRRRATERKPRRSVRCYVLREDAVIIPALQKDGRRRYPTNSTAPGAKRGTCSIDSGKPADVESQQADAYVKFSNIKFGSINSTFAAGGGGGGHVCKDSGCNVCAACCHDYVGDCEACVASQC